MQRLIYFIFMMPLTQLFAMDIGRTAPTSSENRIIMVANTTSHGVTVQVCDPAKVEVKSDDHKIWLGTIRRGQIEVSPPQSPRVLHALVVRDTAESTTLARTDFEHPQEESTLFQVFRSEGIVKIEQREDPTSPVKISEISAQLPEFTQSEESDASLMDVLAAPAVEALVVVAALVAKKYAATE